MAGDEEARSTERIGSTVRTGSAIDDASVCDMTMWHLRDATHGVHG